MIPDNLITYFFIIVAVIVAFLIYRSRNRITTYDDDELNEIKDMDNTDAEIESYIRKHQGTDSQELIDLLNNGNTPENEIHAIKKILTERQDMPTPPNP